MIRATKEKRHGGNRSVSGCADTCGDSGTDPTRSMRLWRILARVGMSVAGRALDRYATATDAPERGIVEAADLLDAARAAMAGGA